MSVSVSVLLSDLLSVLTHSVGMRGYPRHLTEWLHAYFLNEGLLPTLAFHCSVWLRIRVEKGGFGASQLVASQISRC